MNQWEIMSCTFKFFRCISLHSPERMTVNHDVAGSSPARGATKEHPQQWVLFYCLYFPEVRKNGQHKKSYSKLRTKQQRKKQTGGIQNEQA